MIALLLWTSGATRGRRGRTARVAIGGDDKNWDDDGKNRVDSGTLGVIRAKIGMIMGHQASHNFCGRHNCSPPRAPMTHATQMLWTLNIIIFPDII